MTRKPRHQPGGGFAGGGGGMSHGWDALSIEERVIRECAAELERAQRIRPNYESFNQAFGVLVDDLKKLVNSASVSLPISDGARRELIREELMGIAVDALRVIVEWKMYKHSETPSGAVRRAEESGTGTQPPYAQDRAVPGESCSGERVGVSAAEAAHPPTSAADANSQAR